MDAEPILHKVRLPNYFSMTLQSAYAKAAHAVFFGRAPAASLDATESQLSVCENQQQRAALCEEVITFHTPEGDIQHTVNVAHNNQLIGACRDIEEFRCGYEPEIHAAIDLLTGPDAVLYDIGANWGPISLQAALRSNFRGCVHTFEPQQNAFGNLRSIVEALNLQTKVQAHLLAVSDVEGIAHLSNPKWRGNVAIDLQNAEGVACKTVTLDTLGLADPHLIKIDVEGHEPQVLAGARTLLQRARPYVIFEDWRDNPKTHFQQLADDGYCFYRLGWFDPFEREVTEKPTFRSTIQLFAMDSFRPAQRSHLPERINVLASPRAL